MYLRLRRLCDQTSCLCLWRMNRKSLNRFTFQTQASGLSHDDWSNNRYPVMYKYIATSHFLWCESVSQRQLDWFRLSYTLINLFSPEFFSRKFRFFLELKLKEKTYLFVSWLELGFETLEPVGKLTYCQFTA